MDELNRDENLNKSVNEEGTNIIPKKNIEIGDLPNNEEIEELDNTKRSRLRVSILFIVLSLLLAVLIILQLIDIFKNLITNAF